MLYWISWIALFFWESHRPGRWPNQKVSHQLLSKQNNKRIKYESDKLRGLCGYVGTWVQNSKYNETRAYISTLPYRTEDMCLTIKQTFITIHSKQRKSLYSLLIQYCVVFRRRDNVKKRRVRGWNLSVSNYYRIYTNLLLWTK